MRSILVLAILTAGCAGRDLPRLSGPVAFSAPAVDGGERTTLDAGRLRGRPWVADFIFTRCGGPCPLLSANMARLQGELPPGVLLVSFTVDPDHDGLEVLAGYAERHGARPGWYFARLEPRALFELVNAGMRLPVYIDPKAPPASRAIHTTKLVLLDAEGAVRGYYDGLSAGGLAALRRDAQRLLSEVPRV